MSANDAAYAVVLAPRKGAQTRLHVHTHPDPAIARERAISHAKRVARDFAAGSGPYPTIMAALVTDSLALAVYSSQSDPEVLAIQERRPCR